MANQDIKKITKTLEDGDKGFILSFPPPPSGSVEPKDLYRYDFDIVNRLPLNPLSSVVFTPSLPNEPSKASYLSSSINASINIGIAVKSIHKAETQTLVRLRIKDIYNKILYTDYILVICSPQQIVKLNGEILSRLSGSAESIGPNGGRVLRISTTGTTDLLSRLLVKMRVEGPGIPKDKIVTVASFIDDNRSDIELLPYFEIDNEFNINGSAKGNYSFTITTSCLSAEDLREIGFNQQFIILDQDNNWSFFYKEKLVLQFIPNKNLQDNSISLLFDIKNFEALIGEDTASSIPAVGFIFGAGRVDNDTIPINTL